MIALASFGPIRGILARSSAEAVFMSTAVSDLTGGPVSGPRAECLAAHDAEKATAAASIKPA